MSLKLDAQAQADKDSCPHVNVGWPCIANTMQVLHCVKTHHHSVTFSDQDARLS